MKYTKLTIEIICYLLIFIFSYTAISKFLDYNTFVSQLSQSPITTRYADLWAIVVPTVEIAVSLLLVVPKSRLIGIFSSLFIMTSFTTYVYILLNYSFYIPCSCGGVISRMSWDQHLVFNISFVFLCVLAIVCQFSLNKGGLKGNKIYQLP